MADIPVKVIVDAVDNASSTMKGISSSFDDFASKARTVALGFAGIGAATLLVAKSSIEAAGNMEQQQVAFETMLGSADKAKQLLEQMTNFAQRTPFQMTEVVAAGKQLLAYGSSADEVIGQTEMLGNVAAGLGIPLNDLIYLYGTLQVQQKVYTKDLMQFSQRGIDVITPLAAQFGVTKDKVYDLAAQGKISFKDIQDAFEGMTSSGGKFFDLMDKQSKTTLGQFSNLQDSITKVKIALGDALLPAVNNVMEGVTPAVTNFGEWAKANPEVTTSLTALGLSLGGVGSAIIVMKPAIVFLVDLFKLLGGAGGFIWGLIGGFDGLATALSAIGSTIAGVVAAIGWPVTLVILAIIAVVGLLTTAWIKNWGNIHEKFATVVEYIKLSIQNQIEMFGKLVDFIKTLPEKFINMVIGIKNAITTFFTETIPKTITNVKLAFQHFVDDLKTGIYTFFTEKLPFAIGFLVGRFIKFVTEDIPNFIAGVLLWFSELPGKVVTFLIEFWNGIVNYFTTAKNYAINMAMYLVQTVIEWFQMLPGKVMAFLTTTKDNIVNGFTTAKDKAIEIVTRLVTDVLAWFESVPPSVEDFLKKLPGIVEDWFNQAKDKAVQKAKDMYSGVAEWFGKVVDFFKDLIGWADKAISKAGEAASKGFEAGKRQFGGPVSSLNPVMVGEAGPEMFVPQTAGTIIPAHETGRGRGGSTIQFIINASTIINSPTERMQFAEAIYKDLVKMARSQNRTVAEMLGA